MVNVIKANKRVEPFNEEKVINSMRRAGIPPSEQPEVLSHIKGKIYDGISSQEIYRHILEFLERSPQPYNKSRYSLKEAIMNLGPTGYPFEDFIAELLTHFGYETKVRQILNGECVMHEIDVIAKKEGISAMIEAKFHNSPGTRSQIHVALYTQARFEDVKAFNDLDEAWIITNTKTTIEVNTYAKCKKMKVISWNYPEGGSLRDLIEKSGLHPITLLSTLSETQKRILLDNHIVMCKQVCENPATLGLLSLSEADHSSTLNEVIYVCRTE